MSLTTQKLCAFPHCRSPWGGNEQVYVCGRLGRLKGNEIKGKIEQRLRQIAYAEAKLKGNHDAAELLVESIASERVVDRIIDDAEPFMAGGVPIRFVVPHPPFDDDHALGAGLEAQPQVRNVIPYQYANHLAVLLDGTVDDEIIQCGRVGRTTLTKMERYLYQPAFSGDVDQNVAYVLVDDVCTNGGTLAALRSHIIRNGGTVCSVTTLAHGTGEWQKLAISAETWQRLADAFGPNLNEFWKCEIGHEATCLTEAEGRFLAKWAEQQEGGRNTAPLLQRLRSELLATASAGLQRASGSGR